MSNSRSVTNSISSNEEPPLTSAHSHNAHSGRRHHTQSHHSQPSDVSVLGPLGSFPQSSSSHGHRSVRSRPDADRDSSRSRRTTVSRVPVPHIDFPLPIQAATTTPSKDRSPIEPTSKQPSSGKSSTEGLDSGSALGISSKIDLKQLIADRNHSSVSLISTVSDSEGYHPAKRKEPYKNFFVNVTAMIASPTSHPQIPSVPFASPKDPRASGRPRNVLRRKSSVKNIDPVSPTGQPSIHRSRSKRMLSANEPSATPRSTSSPGYSSNSTPSLINPSPRLTPAGEVVAAYKQQEKKKEKLATTSSDVYDNNPSEVDGARVKPHDTVFGTTSGKVIAVGGLEDDLWDVEFVRRDRQRSRSAALSPTQIQDEPSSGGLKKLTRKVSGRWKKNGSSGVEVEKEGNTSNLLERRSSSLPSKHAKRESLDLSIDKTLGMSENGSAPYAKDINAWSSEDVHEKQKKFRDEQPGGGKLWKLVKRLSTGGLKEKFHAQDIKPPPVPALPKDLQGSSHLQSSHRTFEVHSAPHSPMFSSRKESVDSPSPLSRFARSSFSGGHESIRPATSSSAPVFHKYMSSPSPPTTAMRRPITSGHQPMSESPTTHDRPSTQSSSPNSSDLSSPRFLSRTRSTSSSVSSYGEERPPMPAGLTSQHILPPSELFRLEREKMDGGKSIAESTKSHKSANSGVLNMSYDICWDAEDETQRPSLPIPPRRLYNNQRDASTTSSPTANGSQVRSLLSINTSSRVSSRSPMPHAEFGVLSPPPRPVRNARRLPSVSASTRPDPSIPSPADDVEEEVGDGSSSRQSQTSDASTTRPGRLSNELPPLSATGTGKVSSDSYSSYSRSSPNSSAHSQPKYREMGSTATKLWTEKEKAARWDNLLEMSDQAGGTIHLGGGGELLSESVRLSMLDDQTVHDIK